MHRRSLPARSAGPEIYQTLYLTNLTQQNDANELVTDLRNMLPNAKLYYVPSQSAISLRASAEDIALAQKILSDLDKTKKIYRLTYTMTERDGGKTIGVQHFSIIVASGSRTDFKQGSRVPVAVNSKLLPGGRALRLPTWMWGRRLKLLWTVISMGCDCARKVVQSSIVEDKPGSRCAGSCHPADHARRNVDPGPGQTAGARIAGCSG